MKEWIISVGAVILITAIASLILPEGKMGNYLKGIFAFIVILVILQPIFSIRNIEPNLDGILDSNNVVLQDNYMDYVYDKKGQSISNNCTHILNKMGISDAEILIKFEKNDDYKNLIKNVQINLENAVIISDKEHIDIIEEIKIAISNFLNINIDKVVVNE